MSIFKNQKAIAIATTTLCVGSLVWLLGREGVNRSLETNLESEKLKSEALLSEKLMVEKELDKMQTQLSGLRGANEELDRAVKGAEGKLADQESELKKLRGRQASVGESRKQRESLQRILDELRKEFDLVKQSYAQLENENKLLSDNVAQLQSQNLMLSEDLNRAMFTSIDHAQVQAVKGKRDRLTVCARRTNKLIADFEVPSMFTNISYRIIDPNGNALGERDGTIVSAPRFTVMNPTASLADIPWGRDPKRVTMEYVPKQKLQAGIYKVEVLNDNLYVGSLNVKLR